MDSGDLMTELQKLFREMRGGLRAWQGDLPVRPGEMRFLWIVAHRGPLTHTALAELLGVSKPAVSTTVRRMENLGLVAQGVQSGDRRRRMISVSDKGQKLLKELEKIRQERLTQLLNRLTEEEQHVFYRLLAKLVEGSAKDVGPEGMGKKHE